MDIVRPRAVFLCNTSLHVMNALDACKFWGYETNEVWLVLKCVPQEGFDSLLPVVKLCEWGKVVFIGDPPVEGTGLFSFFRHQYSLICFYKKWHKELEPVRRGRRVFAPLNRMQFNRVIIGWLEPRELIWLDDGTLSYVLARDSVLPPVAVRKPKKIVGKKVVKSVKSAVSAKGESANKGRVVKSGKARGLGAVGSKVAANPKNLALSKKKTTVQGGSPSKKNSSIKSGVAKGSKVVKKEFSGSKRSVMLKGRDVTKGKAVKGSRLAKGGRRGAVLKRGGAVSRKRQS